MSEIDYRKLTHLMEYASRLHSYHVATAFHSFKIYRGQPPILSFVLSHPGCSQKEISDNFHITPASVAVSIRRMCASGLIYRTEDEADARVKHIFLTEDGKNVLRKCDRQLMELDQKMFEGVSEDEAVRFRETLTKLISNLTDSTIGDEEILAFLAESGEEDSIDYKTLALHQGLPLCGAYVSSSDIGRGNNRGAHSFPDVHHY